MDTMNVDTGFEVYREILIEHSRLENAGEKLVEKERWGFLNVLQESMKQVSTLFDYE